MIYPIHAYGDPVLRKDCENIDSNYENLEELIEDMFSTMRNAHGVGLAAPQIGLPIRVFIVDAAPMAEDEEFEDIKDELLQFQRVFINPKKVEEKGKEWKFKEGCLSIPEIREDVSRKETITLEYLDENFKKKTETFSDIRARIIQHEYDHIEGVLFIDYLSSLKKKLLKKRLNNISQGNISVDYKMKFPKK